MFGKLKTEIPADLPKGEALKRVSDWADRNKLKKLTAKKEGGLRYRFGNPGLSNPIILELHLKESAITVEGWVQTLIPFFRWKLVEVPGKSVATAVDYRKKGGYFVRDLRDLIAPTAEP
jgi:hypothetical protein